MFSSKKLRDVFFVVHRYLGLAIGLIVILIGLTGSILVFHTEISQAQRYHQIGAIAPHGDTLPVETILNAAKAVYASQPDAVPQALYMPIKPNQPARIAYATKANDWIDNYVDPYTGAFLGNTLTPNPVENFFKLAYKLHYELLAGDIGLKLVGIVGLLMCILTITGVVLWPGWRKLITGFKIKWDAHPKRVSFDLHKVVGIFTVVFLLFTFFTGFAWNLNEFSEPIIRAVTFSPVKVEPVSQLIAGRSPLPLTAQLKTAQSTFPGATLQTVYFPGQPEATISMRYKFPQEPGDEGHSYVYLDQYSGEVLRVDNGLEQSLGDRFLNSFTTLHYGTFWGLPSRILYVFVGLAPLVLFITGSVMWWYRRQATHKSRHLV